MQTPAHGLHIVIISKRIISVIKAVGSVNVKNLIGNIADSGIYGFKSGIIVLIKIIALFMLNNFMIGGNSFNGFVSKIIITFSSNKCIIRMVVW